MSFVTSSTRRILNLDLLSYGCDRVRDYLRTNRELEDSDRHLCEAIGTLGAKIDRRNVDRIP